MSESAGGTLERGAFLLSIDTELAWGSVHSGGPNGRGAQYEGCRPVIDRLLQLLEEYRVRATWAIVGHLFLEGCHATDGCKHPEIVRPAYRWFPGDWFDGDPCSRLEDAPIWYGQDIIAKIAGCSVPQEIGCHTFSHVIVGDEGCSRECLRSELKACGQEAAKVGVELQSFVFPRNSVGHLDVLAEAGFVTYRGVAPSWYGRLPGKARKIGHLMDNLLPFSPPTVLPGNVDGLWNLPASYYYPQAASWWKLVPVAFRVGKAKRGLRQAAERRRIFHMWFHPFNLVTDPDGLLQGLRDILTEVSRYRDAGLLDNPTMGDMGRALGLRTKKEVTLG